MRNVGGEPYGEGMHEEERAASSGDAARLDAERTSRQRALPWFGDVGQRQLRDARVLVIGAGGLAAPAVQYLAAAGVGRLDIVDFDVVEPSNLARQVLFTRDDVGRPKADALADAGATLAPAGHLEGHRVRLTDETTAPLVRRLAPDLVIDTTDDWATRLGVADACAEMGVALVWPSVIGTDGQLTVFSGRPGDPTIDDLVDRETAPQHPVSCAMQGVLGPVCGQLGAMAATEAIKLLVGAGRPLIGRVAVIDGLAATVREIPLVVRRAATEVADASSAAPEAPAEAPAEAATESASSAATDARAGQAAADPTAASRARTWRASASPRPVTRPIPVPGRDMSAQQRGRLVSIDELVAAPLGTVLVDAREESAPDLPWPPAGLELVELVRAPLELLAASIDAGDLPASIERASRVVVTCTFGPRARHAAAMLRAAGVRGVVVLDEGAGGLRAAALESGGESARA